jgi:hypothetical protein
MPQPQFILNFHWRRPSRLFQAVSLRVRFAEIRNVKYSNIGGFRIGHTMGQGRIDHSRLDITSPEVSSYVFRVAATGEGIKRVLRRLRPQEIELLDGIDRQIAELQDRLATLKVERNQALQLAWRHGNVVRLQEVKSLLPAAEAKEG